MGGAGSDTGVALAGWADPDPGWEGVASTDTVNPGVVSAGVADPVSDVADKATRPVGLSPWVVSEVGSGSVEGGLSSPLVAPPVPVAPAAPVAPAGIVAPAALAGLAWLVEMPACAVSEVGSGSVNGWLSSPIVALATPVASAAPDGLARLVKLSPCAVSEVGSGSVDG
jgi:hypothetical protein